MGPTHTSPEKACLIPILQDDEIVQFDNVACAEFIWYLEIPEPICQ